MNCEDTLVGTELLILDAGEKFQSGGPGRHRSEAAMNPVATTATEPLPEEICEDHSRYFGGTYLEEKTILEPPPFLWTDKRMGLADERSGGGPAGQATGWPGNAWVDDAGWAEGYDRLHHCRWRRSEACKEEYPVE